MRPVRRYKRATHGHALTERIPLPLAGIASATAMIRLRAPDGTVTDAAASIASDSTGYFCSYTFRPGDLDAAGVYTASFWVTYPDAVQRYPAAVWVELHVLEVPAGFEAAPLLPDHEWKTSTAGQSVSVRIVSPLADIATASATVRILRGGSVVGDDAAALVLSGGEWRCSYTVQPGDLSQAGALLFEFTATYPDGSVQRYPSDRWVAARVLGMDGDETAPALPSTSLAFFESDNSASFDGDHVAVF
jgi:hypothetical protein